jgi:hypothetical protein
VLDALVQARRWELLVSPELQSETPRSDDVPE